MATKLWAACLVLFCTLLASGGQIFLKIGSKTASLSPDLLFNYTLMVGFLFVRLSGNLVDYRLVWRRVIYSVSLYSDLFYLG